MANTRKGTSQTQAQIAGLGTTSEKVKALRNRKASSIAQRPTVNRTTGIGGPPPTNPPVTDANAVTDFSKTGGTGKTGTSIVRPRGTTGITREELESRKRLLDQGATLGQLEQTQPLGRPGEGTGVIDTTGDTPEVVSSSPLGRQFDVEPGSLEERLFKAADTQTQAQQALLSFLSQPQKSLVDQLKELREQEGRPGLIQTRQETLGEINRIQENITAIRKGLKTEGGAITKAAAARLEGRALADVSPRLQQLENRLSEVNLSIRDIDSTVNTLLSLGQKDRANELERLATLANTTGIGKLEQELITNKIKAEADAVEAQQKDASDFLSDIEDARTLALEAGAFLDGDTGKFEELSQKLQQQVASGEISLLEAQNRLVGSVSNNPAVQASIRAGLKKSKTTGDGTDTGDVSVGDLDTTIKGLPLQAQDIFRDSVQAGDSVDQFISNLKTRKLKDSDARKTIDAYITFMAGQREDIQQGDTQAESIPSDALGTIKQTAIDLQRQGLSKEEVINDFSAVVDVENPEIQRIINEVFQGRTTVPGGVFGPGAIPSLSPAGPGTTLLNV